MTGQNIDARRVTLIVEGSDGRMHGWQILNPRDVAWQHRGLVAGSSHATITATGEFHRMSKSGIANQQIDDQSVEVIPPRGELQ